MRWHLRYSLFLVCLREREPFVPVVDEHRLRRQCCWLSGWFASWLPWSIIV